MELCESCLLACGWFVRLDLRPQTSRVLNGTGESTVIRAALQPQEPLRPLVARSPRARSSRCSPATSRRTLSSQSTARPAPESSGASTAGQSVPSSVESLAGRWEKQRAILAMRVKDDDPRIPVRVDPASHLPRSKTLWIIAATVADFPAPRRPEHRRVFPEQFVQVRKAGGAARARRAPRVRITAPFCSAHR
jgi:hypothetical protein